MMPMLFSGDVALMKNCSCLCISQRKEPEEQEEEEKQEEQEEQEEQKEQQEQQELMSVRFVVTRVTSRAHLPIFMNQGSSYCGSRCRRQVQALAIGPQSVL